MQMISFVLIGFVILNFCLLCTCKKLIKDTEKNIAVSNWILLIASYVFVIYADYRFAVVLGLITISSWFFAKYKKYSYLGVIIALVSLGYYKYTNFFMDSFAHILGLEYQRLSIMLPLGISFYSFSAISYVVDVKRSKIDSRDLKSVALYLSFFPKITSGPIQKSKDFFEQMDADRTVDWNTFLTGIQIFMFGLGKKIVLADRLAVFADQVLTNPLSFGSMTVFLAGLAYFFQIYFDFSGYSDMAVGVAKILGFDLPKNFNLPYLAHNITEFWKRWHMSLSTWLQEYVYIFFGGNRKGEVRTYINLFLTMLFGGLWHGAAWNYIFWGVLNGIGLSVHKLWMKYTKSNEKEQNWFISIISILFSNLFFFFTLMVFRADSLSQAWIILTRMVSFEAGLEHEYLWLTVTVVLFGIACVAAYMKSKDNVIAGKFKNVSKVEGFYPVMDLRKFPCLVAFLVFCSLVLCMAYTGGSPFIYGKY
ncbi:MAG: MBOAT family protein [Lachnospiraceae bacterium]|nr:MBOAT family protein [Lachnospiraceae bacterium]